MYRRRLLGAITSGTLTGIAGCSRDDDLRLTDFSEHRDLAVTFEGEVIQQPSDDGPPQIELRFTNVGPEREFGFTFAPPGLFSSLDLVAIPDDRGSIGKWDHDGPAIVPDAPRDDCWRAANGIVRAGPPFPENRTLGFDDGVAGRYTLLAPRDEIACFPPGTHRFETHFYSDGSEREMHFHLVVP